MKFRVQPPTDVEISSPGWIGSVAAPTADGADEAKREPAARAAATRPAMRREVMGLQSCAPPERAADEQPPMPSFPPKGPKQTPRRRRGGGSTRRALRTRLARHRD